MTKSLEAVIHFIIPQNYFLSHDNTQNITSSLSQFDPPLIIFLIPRPLIYRSLEATKSYSARILAYLLPSLLASVLLNTPKFLEAKFVTHEEGVEENETVVTVVDYEATELRRDPNYIYYYVHWIRYLLITPCNFLFIATSFRLIFTGIVPFCFLSVMNLMIYKKMRMNQRSKVRRKSTLTKSAGNLATILVSIGEYMLIF